MVEQAEKVESQPEERLPGGGGEVISPAISRSGTGCDNRYRDTFPTLRLVAMPADASAWTAVDHVTHRFERQVAHATEAGYLTGSERATVLAAIDLTAAFEGEPPVPCHRDYGPANWLADADGTWTGVIDFEFSYPDVRVADFSRYPDWTWMERPDLIEAFFEGYGRSLTATEERQLLFAHVEYALGAIVWGHENGFFGFEQEGRRSLVRLATSVR